MDDDLDVMTRDQLIGDVKRLRAGIRRHRDSGNVIVIEPRFGFCAPRAST